MNGGYDYWKENAERRDYEPTDDPNRERNCLESQEE